MINYLRIVTFFLLVLLCFPNLYSKEIYISPDGNDQTGSGSIDNPFKSIQSGLDHAFEGDVCIVRGGRYDESVTIATDNITLRNYPGEFVLITGMQKVSGWVKYNEILYKCYFSSSLIDSSMDYTQFFYHGNRQEPARYPDEDADKLSSLEWMLSETHNSGDGTGKVTISRTFPPDYWAGGYYMGTNSKNHNSFNAAKGIIASSGTNQLNCTKICWNWDHNWQTTVGPGRGYIIYHINALDKPGEWHYQNDTIYFYPPEDFSAQDSHTYIRTNIWVLNLTGRTGVKLQGLNIKAGSIDLSGANNCNIDSCAFRYVSPFSTFNEHGYGQKKDGSLGIYVSGSNNIIRNSYIAKGWAGLITLDGENNMIENCVIEDGNWMSERQGLINCYGSGNVIFRNTIRKAGRAGIDGGNKAWINNYGKNYLFQYNHIYETMNLSADGAAFYTNHQGNTDPANAEIKYNWVSHGYKGRVFGQNTSGLYPDNHTSGILMHHNVIYSCVEGFRTNQTNLDIEIYNNTIIDCLESHDRWVVEDNATDIKVYNNIGVNTPFEGTDNQNNILLDTNAFRDWRNFDFRLVEGSPAIDYGKLIADVTDGYLGAAPDAGAYEGDNTWVAGAKWDIKGFEDEPGYMFSSSGPGNLGATNINKGKIQLTWDDNSEGETGFIIFRSDDEQPLQEIARINSPDQTSYTDNAAIPGVKHWYVVQAFNTQFHSIQSNEFEILALNDYLLDNADDFSKTFIKSSNLSTGTGVPEYFGNDKSRFRRTSLDSAFVIWNVLNINKVKATMHFSSSLDAGIDLYLSKNGKNYAGITTTMSDPIPDPNSSWHSFILEDDSITPDGYNFLMLVIKGGSNDYSPQLGKIEIVGNETVPSGLRKPIGNPKQVNKLKVYPNPCTNQIYVVFQDEIPSEISVYSVLGTNYYLPYKESNLYGNSSIVIDTSILYPGLYYVRAGRWNGSFLKM